MDAFQTDAFQMYSSLPIAFQGDGDTPPPVTTDFLEHTRLHMQNGMHADNSQQVRMHNSMRMC